MDANRFDRRTALGTSLAALALGILGHRTAARVAMPAPPPASPLRVGHPGGLPGGGATSLAVAARQTGAPELAAMTLTPADPDAIGFADYRVDYGRMRYLDDLAPLLAESLDIGKADASRALDEAGFARWYESVLFLSDDDDNPLGNVSRNVSSCILEFGAEAGSVDIWDLTGEIPGEALRDVDAIGDASRATHDTGDDYERIDVSFRLGPLHAGVRMIDRARQAPDLADAEALAAMLLDRIETILEEGGPGLSRRALRLIGGEIVPSEDVYLLLDGDAIPFYYETAVDTRQREAAASAGMTDEYIVWQRLARLGAGDEDDIWYFLSLRRFDDQGAASGWLAGTGDRIRDAPAVTGFEVDDAAPTFGDESVMYTVDAVEYEMAYRSLVMQLGPVVATIELRGPEGPPGDAVEALAETQRACLGRRPAARAGRGGGVHRGPGAIRGRAGGDAADRRCRDVRLARVQVTSPPATRRCSHLP